MFKYLTITLLVLVLILSSQTFGQINVTTLTAEFTGSGGVAVDSAGYVYVADFGTTLGNANGTNVYRVSPHDGSFSVYASGLQGASGNGFDSKGNLFQSNIAASKVSKISQTGEVSDFASANIAGPVGIAVGMGDTVFVANCNTNSISKVTPDGVSSVFVSSGLFSCPNGLTFDGQGNLYTSNFNNGWIIKITPDKEVSNFALIPGNNNGHITFANNKLYVVARGNHQIFEVDLDGTARLLVGNGIAGNEDGIDGQVSFYIPNGIRASRTGDTLYVNSATSPDVNNTLNPVVLRMISGVLAPRRSYGYPFINSIFPALTDTVLVKGKRIDFAVEVQDTSGFKLFYEWTLNGAIKSTDTTYNYRASAIGVPRSDTVTVSISNGFNTSKNTWIVEVVNEITSINESNPAKPEKFSLNQNYPNPFNPSTTIEYVLPKKSYVVLNIYNILGNKIRTLVNQNQTAGVQSVIWNGDNDNGDPVASGNYFYEIVVNNISQTNKMILSK